MTDSENIKAFECCEANGGQNPQCDACPYHYIDEKNDPCYIEVRREILKILNNERAQIKSLEAKVVIQKGLIDHQQAEIERLQNLTEKDFEQTAISTVKRHQKWIEYRAVKEFAERLCADRVSNDPVVIAVKAELKEMEGEK